MPATEAPQRPDPQRLDPLALPLRGSRLIEASAGTGKTWTLAALYLRLVLGHGDAVRGPEGEPLRPPQILVMTFTRAATRELVDRIRVRLVEAAQVFAGAQQGDALLQALCADYPAGSAREQAAWQLSEAAAAMDEAAVCTIDAWCQRALREHSFSASGAPLGELLLADESALLQQAANDLWRQQVYPMADAPLAALLTQWPSSTAMLAAVQPLLALEVPAGDPEPSLATLLQTEQQQANASLQQLKDSIGGELADFAAWLESVQAPKTPAFKRTNLGSRQRWLEALRSWAATPDMALPALTDTAWARLCPTGFEAIRTEASPAVALHPLLTPLGALLPQLLALQAAPGQRLRLQAARLLQQRLQQLKAAQRSAGFDDLLRRLDEALDPALAGERAEQLRALLLAQYPAALIDEFQDTSPRQLRVFDRLYRIADNAPERCLLLIGDPKQAIYGFRGADLPSYLRARSATAGRHQVLATNFRSTPELVAAVNALFLPAESRPGGAFGLRVEGGDNPLPFVAVQAHGRTELLQRAGQPLPPVSLQLLPQLLSKEASHQLLAAACAEQLHQWLRDAQCGFAGPSQPWQRLRPADCAVLVRDRREAQAMREALARRGLESVYLSARDSVFASDEAQDLLRLLQAVAAPRDARLARAWLASALLDWPLDRLLHLVHDDDAFDAQAQQLQLLHGVWRSQGVLALVRRALQLWQLPRHWLPRSGGERRLTNVLHLGELLQAAASLECDGEAALLRWLRLEIDAALQGASSTSDEHLVRLESDADRIQLVTLHKSKGLEYPVVLLPFAAQVRAAKKDFVTAATPDGGRHWLPQPSDEALAAFEAERLQEDTRLLYVGLTRARHALWLGVALPKARTGGGCNWHASALGRLLSGPQALEPMDACESLVAWAKSANLPLDLIDPEALQAAAGPHSAAKPSEPLQAPVPLRPVSRYAVRFERSWGIASFSALVRDVQAAAPAPSRALRDDEPTLPTLPQLTPAARAALPIEHRFRRGAQAGNLLHEQLEWLAGEGFDASPATQQQLQRRLERQGIGSEAAAVADWLLRCAHTPLPPLQAKLAALPRALPEMEFWLPTPGWLLLALDAICHRHLLPGRERPQLPERELQGLLMGFADLVLELPGQRFAVLDHKSNALGLNDAAYTEAAMQAAVLSHRYDLQAALYLLALHRLLRQRLGSAYRPAQQLLGAVFLFLRGIGAPQAGALLLPASEALLAELDALDHAL